MVLFSRALPIKATNLFLLGLCTFALSHEPPLPTMPSHFATSITANFAKASETWENSTLFQREFYDFESNRFRTSTRSVMGVHHVLHNFDLKATWTWEGENPHEPIQCSMILSSESNASKRIANSSGHVRPSYNLLNWAGPDRVEVYKGQKEINGILTDTWAAEQSFYSPQRQMWINWTTTYAWTARSWKTADGSDTVPVRAEVSGFHCRVDSDGVHGVEKNFFHTYEFSSFTSGVVDDHHFAPPHQCDTTAYCGATKTMVDKGEIDLYGDAQRLYQSVCIKDNVANDEDNDDHNHESGGKATAGVIGGFLGVVLGATGFALIQRMQRRSAKERLADQMQGGEVEQIRMSAI